MAIDVNIKDGTGTGNDVCVTSRNQLITAPLDYSEFYEAVAIVNNVPFNVVPAKTGKNFVITDMDIYANKGVGVNDATVEVYEADSATSATADKCIYRREMVKQTSTTMNGLNIIVTSNKWVNIITDDNTVYINLAGYYIDAV